MGISTIDLHIHTNCSDGDYSPRDLIKYASKHGMKIISITDHDTITAYESNIIEYAKKFDIILIPGIEFSTVDEVSGQKIHVVGLNIDINNSDLKSLCNKINISRREAVLSIKDKLSKIGIELRSDKLFRSKSVVTKSHIGKDVITNPNNEKILKEIYNEIPLQGTFIEDYLIINKLAYVDKNDKLLVSEAIAMIKQSGGKSFCAHPSSSVMQGFDFKQMKKLIIRNKFDGVEAINIQYNKSDNDKRFDMVKEFLEFTKDNNLLISGGSDFHSENQQLWGKMSSLGLKNEKYHITQDIVDKIIYFDTSTKPIV